MTILAKMTSRLVAAWFLLSVMNIAAIAQSASTAVWIQVHTSAYTDLYDQDGNLAIGFGEYLSTSRVEVSLVNNNTDVLVTIVVRGSIPDKNPPDSYLTWRINIDADRNPKTGLVWKLGYNDIGVDYGVYVGMVDDQRAGFIYSVSSKTFTAIPEEKCKFEKNSVSFMFHLTTIGNPDAFDYVITNGHFDKKGRAGSRILAADKIPREKHYTFPARIVKSLDKEYSRVREAEGKTWQSSKALSSIKQAKDTLAMCVKTLNEDDFKTAEEHLVKVPLLVQQASEFEKQYSTTKSAEEAATKAIGRAESDGRTKGLDQAKSLLQQGIISLDTGDYARALDLFKQAMDAADKAEKPSPPYELYATGVGAVVTIVAIAILLARKKER